MNAILKYILKNGVRDRLYIGLFVSLIITFGVSVFLGSTMLVEQQATTVVFIAGSSRVILAVGMILFVCLSINRAFENKEVEFILSKAISRQQFVLAYLIGFFVTSLLIFIPLAIAIFLISNADKVGLIIWLITLLLENFLVIIFALLVSLILKNSFSAIMASFAFYIIARLMGMFVMAIKLPQDIALIKNNFLAIILKFFSVLFPRLDLFAQSSWLIYGFKDYSQISIILLQFFIYFLLLIFMSFHDFKKKQF